MNKYDPLTTFKYMVMFNKSELLTIHSFIFICKFSQILKTLNKI